MMSLTSASLSNIVLTQFRYKMKAYIGVFLALILVQVLGIFLATLGTSFGSISNNLYSIYFEGYSSSAVIILTFIWAFMNAILITTKAYREDDFTFVSTRISYNLANMLFLITISGIGAITALLSNGIIRLFVYFTADVDVFLVLNSEVGISYYGVGLISTFLYVLLFAIAGYVIGMMIQISRLFLLLIPAIFITFTYLERLEMIVGFYFLEQSFLVFVVKVITTILIGSAFILVLSNRLEVRR